MAITVTDVLTFLYILIGIMLVVVLYHVLMLAADARRIMKRADRIVEQVERVVLKPLAIADQVLENLMDLFQGKMKRHDHLGHKKSR